MSGILLLSGTVLVAVGLLLYWSATSSSATARLAWEPSSRHNLTSFITKRQIDDIVRLSLPNSLVHSNQGSYFNPDMLAYRNQASGQPGTNITVRKAGPSRLTVATTGVASSAMQRSWNTIKQMFR